MLHRLVYNLVYTSLEYNKIYIVDNKKNLSRCITIINIAQVKAILRRPIHYKTWNRYFPWPLLLYSLWYRALSCAMVFTSFIIYYGNFNAMADHGLICFAIGLSFLGWGLCWLYKGIYLHKNQVPSGREDLDIILFNLSLMTLKKSGTYWLWLKMWPRDLLYLPA